jgi:hypothetical protein
VSADSRSCRKVGRKGIKEMGDGLDASRGMIGFAAGFRGWIGVGVGGIGP